VARKIALCVGINRYLFPEIPPLGGCVNDAVLIGELLRIAGFEVRQLHDEAATQQGILERLSVETAKLRPGDYFVYWGSCHGTQVQDRSGDELLDFKDEAICTYDHDDRDAMTDDKIGQIISRADPDATIVFCSDSCHSGTVAREVTQKRLNADEAGPLVREGLEQGDGVRARMWVPPPDIVFRTGEPLINLDAYVQGMGARQEEPRESEVRRFGQLRRGISEQEMRHLLLSGCTPDQLSWDAPFQIAPQGSRQHGAMTYNFATAVLGAWSKGQAISYKEAYEATHKGVRERFNQDPQLEGPDTLKEEYVFDHQPH
jgi:hypothetical protein